MPGTTKGRFSSPEGGKTGTGAAGKAGAELVSTSTVPQTMQEESRQGPDARSKLN